MASTSSDGTRAWVMRRAINPALVAVGLVLAALALTVPLQRFITYPFVFLFFIAVMASAWFGGKTAGLISVVLSSVLISFYFVPPYNSMNVSKDELAFMVAFILCAVGVAVMSLVRKRAETAMRVARDELDVEVRARTRELEHSNQEYRESVRQLRMLTEAIPQQIWRTDAEGRIEYCNHYLCESAGVSLDGLKGEAFFSVLHPEDEPLFRQCWSRSLATGQPLELEARVRSREGGYRWFLVRSLPQRTEQGNIACWYGIHIDIERQHKAQQELLQAQEDLSHLSRTLSLAEMAASIAHELNQPLTAVVTHAYACREWLNTEPANLEKASATAEKIVQESTRASAVVSRVRALFRKEAQVRQRTDLNRLVEDLTRLLRDEAIRRGVTIRVVRAEGLRELPLDTVQIQQVLLNLAMNGMDAMAGKPGSRELTIRAWMREEDEVQVAIQDCGTGVPAEVAEKIFEPFFSTKPHGIGMGLAICRSIVEAHDGRLWTENLPGGGAIFQFTLRAQL
jgi:PAS domain S-box-containing protein